ncbi:hypothetical protein [Chondromyces apiculatus]|uniref:Apple domain-containing protein n=1 Tax=Chondromyces apiculatus DSM 436 TaxID=1192034 RepID=A0A017T0L6_9BACT|nr:hypothetical protein [Chondromyces apiculatus]EYF02773.1 Hypothetical protein CAP_6508 [Chondromyces apiculatus DSM 436]
MNFKTALMASALMAFSSAFAMGCGGTPCDDAADYLVDECGLPEGDGGEDSDAECTAQLECASNCIMETDCSAFTDNDAEALASYAECAAEC